MEGSHYNSSFLQVGGWIFLVSFLGVKIRIFWDWGGLRVIFTALNGMDLSGAQASILATDESPSACVF
jgi:hypothetical protein